MPIPERLKVGRKADFRVVSGRADHHCAFEKAQRRSAGVGREERPSRHRLGMRNDTKCIERRQYKKYQIFSIASDILTARENPFARTRMGAAMLSRAFSGIFRKKIKIKTESRGGIYYKRESCDQFIDNFSPDTICITIKNMTIALSYDGKDYSFEHKFTSKPSAMDNSFYDPTMMVKTINYECSDVEIEGEELRNGIKVLATIIQDKIKVIDSNSCGHVHIYTDDASIYKVDSNKYVPIIDIMLYDIDGSMINAMKRAFFASRLHGLAPKFRLILGKWGDDTARKVNIERVIVWELYGDL